MMDEDEQQAREIADLLMRHALTGGPLTAVRRLTRLLRILRIVVRVVTAERDRHAHAMSAVWPQRRAAELVGVTSSTMQRWMEAGRGQYSHSIEEFRNGE